jgi:SOS response regulatory protein OraA/RecX
MDPIGKVVREFLKKAHSNSLRNALALATELQSEENMDSDQISEMLCASGFEPDIIAEALSNLPEKKS